MWLSRKDYTTLRADAAEAARTSGENAVLRSQMLDLREDLLAAQEDLRLERKAKDKLLDKVLQKHGQKGITEPPPKPPPVQGELKLTAIQESERDMWRESMSEKFNQQQIDTLYTSYLRGEYDPFNLQSEDDAIG